MHTLCTLFLGVCTPCADFFWVHAHFFQTLKIPPFSPSCTGSFRIPVSLIGLITSPTSLDRNSKVLFSVVLKGLKSLHSLHGVHEVCTGLPPDVYPLKFQNELKTLIISIKSLIPNLHRFLDLIPQFLQMLPALKSISQMMQF